MPPTLLLQQGRASCSTQEHLRAAALRSSCRRGKLRPSGSSRTAGRRLWRRSRALSHRRRHWARGRAGARKTNRQQRHDMAGECSSDGAVTSFYFLFLLMRSEQVPDVLPGVNDRELQKEFDVIAGSRTPFPLSNMSRDPPPSPSTSAVLDDTKGNWERRLSCLRRLQSLALGSLAPSPLAPSLVKLVRGGLVKGIRSHFQHPSAHALMCNTRIHQRLAQRHCARSCRGNCVPC